MVLLGNRAVRARALAAAGLLVLGCGGDASPGGTVTSDDGKAILSLPDGALPDGVNLEDITITRIEPGFGDDFVVGYRLEPDGIVLSKSASFAIDTFDEVWTGNRCARQ